MKELHKEYVIRLKRGDPPIPSFENWEDSLEDHIQLVDRSYDEIYQQYIFQFLIDYNYWHKKRDGIIERHIRRHILFNAYKEKLLTNPDKEINNEMEITSVPGYKLFSGDSITQKGMYIIDCTQCEEKLFFKNLKKSKFFYGMPLVPASQGKI